MNDRLITDPFDLLESTVILLSEYGRAQRGLLIFSGIASASNSMQVGHLCYFRAMSEFYMIDMK